MLDRLTRIFPEKLFSQVHKRHRLYQTLALFFMGFMTTLAWAPYEQPYMLFLSLNVLVWRLWFCDSPRKAMIFAWIWGYGFYIGNVFWIGNSLLVDAQRFAWLLPISTFGLPALLALYTACLGLCMGWLRRVCGPYSFALSFVLGWGLLEWAQGHFFTGFPWNLAAYIWMAILPLAQGAAFLGSYGLGLLTVFLFCVPAACILSLPTMRRFLFGTGLMVVGLGALFFLGKSRLWQHPTMFHEAIYMRLVQPFIPQKEKGNVTYAYAHFSSLVQHTRAPSAHPLTHVLWPESAIPWSMTPALLENFPNLHVTQPFRLLTGAVYHDGLGQAWNALLSSKQASSDVAVLEPVYYKKHLVPFGEYIPYRSFLESFIPSFFLKKVTPGSKDFSKGSKPSLIRIEDTPPFRALICYEAIFPEQHVSVRPEWLLNVTNDAWFGYSPGPYQHFSSAKMRAIEEGLPLIRVANSGISAFVDPLGRVLLFLDLNQEGILDGFLPKSIPPTIYVLWGNSLFWLLCGLLAVIALGVRRYEQRYEQHCPSY